MKQQLKDLIIKHDWYFDYSDDNRVYQRGYDELLNIINLRKQLNCPFTILELKYWRLNDTEQDNEIKQWFET